MKTLHLYGSLKEKFGGPYRLDVDTPREAVRALCVQIPDFEETIRAGKWHVIRGSLDERDEVDEDSVDVSLGHQDEVHMIPYIEGANNGWTNVIIGAVLIVAGVMYDWSGTTSAMGMALISGGVGLAVGGIIQLTTKMPGADTTSRESIDEKASFLFNGPTNQSSQGVAVPRGYGRLIVGSIVVSAGIYAEELT